jgi:MFS family permease
LLSLSNFFLFTSFFLLLSALPLFAMRELHAREEQVGLIIGMFTVAAILLRPYAGMMLDRWGRRSVVLFSLFFFVMAVAGYFGVVSIAILFLLRLFHGATFGVTTTALGTVAADLVPDSRRGEGLGYFGMFNMLAMVMGPALGLMLIQHLSAGWLFGICLLLALVAWGLALGIRYPEPKKEGAVFRWSDWNKMIEKRAFPYSLPIVWLAVVFGGLVSFIPLYAQELGSADYASSFYMVYALALALARVIAGKAFDRKGPDVVVYPALFAYVAGLLCLGMAHGPLLFVVAGALIGIGYGSVQPCMQALVIREMPEERRGAATATFYIAVDAGIGLGSFLLGFPVVWWGYRGMFLALNLFVLLAGVLYTRVRLKGRMREHRPTRATERKSA